MKKLINLLLAFMLLFTSTFAVTMSFDQNSNLAELQRIDVGNRLYTSHAASLDEVLGIDGNLTYDYDYVLEISQSNEEFYLAIENYFVNSTYNIMFRGDTTKDPTLYIQELVFNEQGQYLLKVIPSYTEEPIKLYIDMVQVQGQSGAFDVYYFETKPEGFNELMSGLIGGFEDIIEINVSFWRVLFYLFIFVIGALFVAGLFTIAFMLFKNAKKIEKRERGQ